MVVSLTGGATKSFGSLLSDCEPRRAELRLISSGASIRITHEYTSCTLRGALASSAFLAQVASGKQRITPQFSRSAISAHMSFLADDLLEGRGTGTRGQEIAAKYIAANFEALGLEPAETNSSYFQTVPLREITVDSAASALWITTAGQSLQLRWGEDFIIRGSELQPDASVEGPAVFVGFGVVNRNRNYDDYAGIDVIGKIVAVLFGAPASYPAEERAHFASMWEKVREAASRGSIGIITFRTPETERILPWPHSGLSRRCAMS
jgi:hypothetical protein